MTYIVNSTWDGACYTKLWKNRLNKQNDLIVP
jgi:hypothetical protein